MPPQAATVPSVHSARLWDQPVAVRVRAAEHVSGPVTVAVSGQVEANVTAMTAFEVPGRVTRVLADEGQRVKAGQVLAELETADYRNQFDAAAAQADAAAASARKAEHGLRPQELEQARIDFERWQDEYTRMKLLYDRKSLAANDFKKIEAGYRAAGERFHMAQAGTRPEEREASDAQSRGAAAQRSEAAKRLADCRLRAPMAGVVSLRRIDAGDMVAAGMPVMAVLEMDPVKVRVGVPEAEIGRVKQGERAVVTIPALDGRTFEGKVDAVSAAADPQSRTYTVKIVLGNKERLLKAGMVAEARIFSDTKQNLLTVPAEAVERDERGVTQVWVYERDKQRVNARRVEVGSSSGSEVEIRSGLNGDEQVVVAGGQKLREGGPARLAGGEK